MTSPLDFAPVPSKELLEIQSTIECGFTLNCVRGMTRIYSQIIRKVKYSEDSSILWSIWTNG